MLIHYSLSGIPRKKTAAVALMKYIVELLSREVTLSSLGYYLN